MKRFYVHYGDFANTYRLAWAETPEQVEEAEKRGYERITRKEAENLCAEENRRKRKTFVRKKIAVGRRILTSLAMRITSFFLLILMRNMAGRVTENCTKTDISWNISKNHKGM
jgi:hypothetical protein